MSRSRLPPTPSMSGELIIKEQPMDGPDSFALPPAVLTPAKVESPSRRSSKSDHSLYCPASPTSPDLVAVGHKSNPPRQTGAKRRLDDLDLPPPPTRARKIIQMKPKTETPAKPAKGKQPKESDKASPNGTANSKKKQSGGSSASGRKMARKTAHSLIERRRRSKMNEEFSTLKDMIPACRGQEMHKLAILQASIDYVNYLEECIQDLKVPDAKRTAPPPGPPSPASPDTLAAMSHPVHTHSASVSPELLPDGAQGNGTSPSFSPRSQVPTGAFEFTTVLPSPVLGPSQAAEIRRHSSQQWPGLLTFGNTSPAMQSRQSNSSSYGQDVYVDHEASAALLMLNRDRRGTADSISERPLDPNFSSREPSHTTQEPPKKMGLSVSDLLIPELPSQKFCV